MLIDAITLNVEFEMRWCRLGEGGKGVKVFLLKRRGEKDSEYSVNQMEDG